MEVSVIADSALRPYVVAESSDDHSISTLRLLRGKEDR